MKGVHSWTWVARTTDVKVIREAADATLVTTATGAGATTAGVVPIAVQTMTFVEPLHCAGCMKVVTKALRANAPVKEVSIPESLETVTVVYDTRTGKVADFEKALADAARQVKPSTMPAVK